MKKILKDTRTIDLFTSRFIEGNRKVDDFLTFHLLNLIMQNKDFIPKKGLVIIIPEIENACPKRPKGYKESLVRVIYEFLQLARVSNVHVIADAQSLAKLNKDVEGKFNLPLLGHTTSVGGTGNNAMHTLIW